jgi:Domain of unknown function (DUF4157)
MHPVVGAKLRVGARSDPAEAEANRVAGAVLGMPKQGAERGRVAPRRPGFAAAGESGLQTLPGRGQALAQPLREFFEPRFGCDFGGVRIHTGARAAAMAESLQARAFAVGRDVVFGASEFAPETSRGRELIAHELTHVVQQERSAAESSTGTIRRQPKPEAPEFPDFPHLALRLEDDIGQNLFDYGHHFYRLATLYPDRPELLQEAFGRYALGANVLTTGFRFLGLDQTAASRLAIGSGILFKGLTFASKGEVVLDFQFDIGRGLKLETNFNLGVDPDDYSKVKKADVGIGVVGHF